MFDRIAVYVVAHQDDWQLFMDPNISTDITDPKCRVVVIHTTAGDAGEDHKYWRAREEGAISSLLFRISHRQNVKVEKKHVRIGNKKIYLARIDNCSFYFLRLPDGGMHGSGFPSYGFQSLSRIRLELIEAITTVDGVNTFHHFREVSNLCNDIIKRELGASLGADTSRMTLNFPDYDPRMNPNDHNDHYNTALLLAETALYGTIKKYAFVHYHSQHAATDLGGMHLFWKIGMFCVYHQTVMNIHGYSTIDESPQYNVWVTKDSVWREVI